MDCKRYIHVSHMLYLYSEMWFFHNFGLLKNLSHLFRRDIVYLINQAQEEDVLKGTVVLSTIELMCFGFVYCQQIELIHIVGRCLRILNSINARMWYEVVTILGNVVRLMCHFVVEWILVGQKVFRKILSNLFYRNGTQTKRVSYFIIQGV